MSNVRIAGNACCADEDDWALKGFPGPEEPSYAPGHGAVAIGG